MIAVLRNECVEITSLDEICNPSINILKANCIEVKINDFEDLALAVITYAKFIPNKIVVKLGNCDEKLIKKVLKELVKYIPQDSFDLIC